MFCCSVCYKVRNVSNIEIRIEKLKPDFIDSKTPIRKSLSDDDVNQKIINQEIALIKSISSKNWEIIERWGAKTGLLSQYFQDIALNISVSIKNNRNIGENLRIKGISILEFVIYEVPELLESEQPEKDNETIPKSESSIDDKLILKMVEWDSRVKILTVKQRGYLTDFAYGLKKLNVFHERNIKIYLEKLRIAGFKE